MTLLSAAIDDTAEDIYIAAAQKSQTLEVAVYKINEKKKSPQIMYLPHSLNGSSVSSLAVVRKKHSTSLAYLSEDRIWMIDFARRVIDDFATFPAHFQASAWEPLEGGVAVLGTTRQNEATKQSSFSVRRIWWTSDATDHIETVLLTDDMALAFTDDYWATDSLFQCGGLLYATLQRVVPNTHVSDKIEGRGGLVLFVLDPLSWKVIGKPYTLLPPTVSVSGISCTDSRNYPQLFKLNRNGNEISRDEHRLVMSVRGISSDVNIMGLPDLRNSSAALLIFDPKDHSLLYGGDSSINVRTPSSPGNGRNPVDTNGSPPCHLCGCFAPNGKKCSNDETPCLLLKAVASTIRANESPSVNEENKAGLPHKVITKTALDRPPSHTVVSTKPFHATSNNAQIGSKKSLSRLLGLGPEDNAISSPANASVHSVIENIGIGLAVGFGVFFLLGIAFVLLRRRRSKNADGREGMRKIDDIYEMNENCSLSDTKGTPRISSIQLVGPDILIDPRSSKADRSAAPEIRINGFLAPSIPPQRTSLASQPPSNQWQPRDTSPYSRAVLRPLACQTEIAAINNESDFLIVPRTALRGLEKAKKRKKKNEDGTRSILSTEVSRVIPPVPLIAYAGCGVQAVSSAVQAGVITGNAMDRVHHVSNSSLHRNNPYHPGNNRNVQNASNIRGHYRPSTNAPFRQDDTASFRYYVNAPPRTRSKTEQTSTLRDLSADASFGNSFADRPVVSESSRSGKHRCGRARRIRPDPYQGISHLGTTNLMSPFPSPRRPDAALPTERSLVLQHQYYYHPSQNAFTQRPDNFPIFHTQDPTYPSALYSVPHAQQYSFETPYTYRPPHPYPIQNAPLFHHQRYFPHPISRHPHLFPNPVWTSPRLYTRH